MLLRATKAAAQMQAVTLFVTADSSNDVDLSVVPWTIFFFLSVMDEWNQRQHPQHPATMLRHQHQQHHHHYYHHYHHYHHGDRRQRRKFDTVRQDPPVDATACAAESPVTSSPPTNHPVGRRQQPRVRA